MGGLDMFKEMRRQDRKLEQEASIEILKKGEYGVLSTIGENGYPYGIPVNYVYIDDSIYFHSALEGQKLDNIQYTNKVSFCVVGQTEVLAEQFSTAYESVVVFGKASEVQEEEKTKAFLALIDKYSAAFTEKGREYIEKAAHMTKVIKINAEQMTGKARRA
jgi:uncharacterized protein